MGTMTDLPRLPKGFTFGTSTASYQIEGAVHVDGRGMSIWDSFCAKPGTILDSSSGAVACDHYHRLDEDVALMAGLGTQGYRFSIAWPRIQPTGSGAPNQAGIDFYSRLVDKLLEAGIEPMATLYHWDLPQALEDQGGWVNRDTTARFGEYAAIMAEAIGDRVGKWCPVNEPNVVTLLGYGLGIHAPGKSLMFDSLAVAHHLNVGHGLAVQALRANGAKAVGSATNHMPVWPLSQDEDDLAAAGLYDDMWNRMAADPMLLGSYPGDFAMLMPVADGDLETIHQPLDFYGVNYYNPMKIGAAGKQTASVGEVTGSTAEGFGAAEMPFSVHEIEGYERTGFGWPIVPSGMTEVLMMLRDRYPDIPPIYVTENGCAYAHGPDEEGYVDDQPRIDYYNSHLRAVAHAASQGVDVRGYYAWSLMDNFEWAEGYTQRFGLVHIDFDTLKRTPKASYEWYADVIKANK